MPLDSSAVSLHPYWKIHEGNMDRFQDLCRRFVAAVAAEPKCRYYSFSFNGDEAFCREAYHDADGVLDHLANVGPILNEALKISQIARLEIHGPERELAKLRQPLAAFNPVYFTVLYDAQPRP